MSSLRVLAVDDEGTTVRTVARYLELELDDVETVTETDPEDALNLLEVEAFDCVISDYEMPRMDGLEFLTEVRERDANVPFILYTGRGSEEVASDAIAAGVTDYLQKGGTETFELLANRVEHAVQEAGTAGTDADDERFRAVFEGAHDAIFVLDPESGTVEEANPAAAGMLGYDREALQGMSIEEIHPHDLEAVIEFAETVLAEGGDLIRTECVTAEGEEVPGEAAGAVIEYEGETRVLAIVRDLRTRETR
jgi:PAS domain S-box-containing protein